MAKDKNRYAVMVDIEYLRLPFIRAVLDTAEPTDKEAMAKILHAIGDETRTYVTIYSDNVVTDHHRMLVIEIDDAPMGVKLHIPWERIVGIAQLTRQREFKIGLN